MCSYSTFRERVYKVSWGHFCSFRIELQFSFSRISFHRLKTSHIGFYSSATQLSRFMTSLFLFFRYAMTLICYWERSLRSLSPLQDIYFLLLICDIEAEENCAFWVVEWTVSSPTDTRDYGASTEPDEWSGLGRLCTNTHLCSNLHYNRQKSSVDCKVIKSHL